MNYDQNFLEAVLKKFNFHPVISLPPHYAVYDFTKGPDPSTKQHQYGIGRYNEKRQGMYEQKMFIGQRNIHVGIDIQAPAQTKVQAFFAGEVFLFADNNQSGDYGPTIITKHVFDEVVLFALFGHLSRSSLVNKTVGAQIKQGEVIATIGDMHENGGWFPHLHFQLCLVEPTKADLPGVVSDAQHADALKIYPDPRLVLGALY